MVGRSERVVAGLTHGIQEEEGEELGDRDSDRKRQMDQPLFFPAGPTS